MSQQNWTRWGLPRPRPGQPAPDQQPSATAPVITAPTIESLLPLQPLSAVLSTSHLQRRSQPNAAHASVIGVARSISGTAVRFGVVYDVGGFKEVVLPGAFKLSIIQDDARLIFNADTSRIIGRQSARTLRVWESPDGLQYDAIPPDTQWCRDLTCSMTRGDIDSCGAAFYITDHRWEQRGNDRVRVIKAARLLFISVDAFATAGSAVADTEERIAAARKLGHTEGQLAAGRATVQ